MEVRYQVLVTPKKGVAKDRTPKDRNFGDGRKADALRYKRECEAAGFEASLWDTLNNPMSRFFRF